MQKTVNNIFIKFYKKFNHILKILELRAEIANALEKITQNSIRKLEE